MSASHLNPSTTLLDTSDHSDAILCGYDGPRDYREDGEGLRVSYEAGRVPCITLNGIDGEVVLQGLSEIEQVWKVLGQVLGGVVQERKAA